VALTRRRLLASLGAGGVAVAAGGGGYALGRNEGASEPDAAAQTVPFFGDHQAGIVTPAQDRLHFAAFDVEEGLRAADLRDLLRASSGAAERMTTGRPVGDVNREALAPPQDTGEAFGLTPARLTVTFGFGPSLFDERFGLGGRRPAALRPLPPLPGDELDRARSGGDLCVQACADDPQVAFHAVRNLARIGRGAVTVRWSQLGFGRTSSTSRAQATPRNLMGFKDGANNLKAEDDAAIASHVWVASADPAWLRGGTYLVARRIRMLIEVWDRTGLADQEGTIGRHKLSGAPLGARDEFAPVRPARLPADSHVRLARPDGNGALPCCVAATRSPTVSTTASASSTPASSSSPSRAIPTPSSASSAASAATTRSTSTSSTSARGCGRSPRARDRWAGSGRRCWVRCRRGGWAARGAGRAKTGDRARPGAGGRCSSVLVQSPAPRAAAPAETGYG
jgi:deferrochelatase/peroxidase EfeB